MSAKYLIRIDDVCPTMNWRVWQEVEPVLLSEGIKPIVSIVPDNHDEKLKVHPPAPQFWDRVRSWQANRWGIALHGYQHRYVTQESGLIGLNRYSEFAGLSRDEQEYKLQRALEVFEREGVRPQLWVAPAHSMDATTVSALRAAGIRHISDGFALFPYLDAGGTLWIPQQLWRFRRMPFGVWTVCFHPNDWTARHVARFRRSVANFRSQIVSADEVIGLYENRRLRLADEIFGTCYSRAMACRMRICGWLEKRRAPRSPAALYPLGGGSEPQA